MKDKDLSEPSSLRIALENAGLFYPKMQITRQSAHCRAKSHKNCWTHLCVVNVDVCVMLFYSSLLRFSFTQRCDFLHWIRVRIMEQGFVATYSYDHVNGSFFEWFHKSLHIEKCTSNVIKMRHILVCRKDYISHWGKTPLFIQKFPGIWNWKMWILVP